MANSFNTYVDAGSSILIHRITPATFSYVIQHREHLLINTSAKAVAR